MTVIRTERLSKTYRGKLGQLVALDGLSVEVQPGEIFGFLGPNGAGKTTTIHLLLGLIKPTTGTAWMFERSVEDVLCRRRVGYVPESVNLHDSYNAAGLLNFYGALCGMSRAEVTAGLTDLLRLVGLEEVGKRPMRSYSKGMLQRLGMAQALLHDPDLLILDEPTSSLDPVGRKEFREILLGLKRRGKAVFISSHILSEVESICDRVAILKQGRLLKIGSLQELSREGGVTFVIAHCPAGLLDALAALPVQVAVDSGRVTVTCQDTAQRRTIERLLTDQCVEVQSIEQKARSLEEIFFAAIDEEPRR